MSELIAFFGEKDVEFFDINGKKVDCDKPERHTIYAILPDKYFFFFQSDIISKRRAYLTIEAYAKSIFPLERGFVGYIGDLLPLIGYVCFFDKIPSRFMSILEYAKIITTPFSIYLQAYASKQFIYKSDEVCSVYYNSKLKHYIFGDECFISQKDDIPSNMEKINCSKEETIKKLLSFISSNSLHKVNLPINKDTKGGFEEWKIYRFMLLAVATLIFITGGILRYSYYKKELSGINRRIEAVYKKALGDKHFNDPYGVLLYKAEYVNDGGYSIEPLSLLYALSKAKNSYKVQIDYISFGKNGIKITGKINNYTSLAGYADKISAILSKKFVIQNTSSKKRGLVFTLKYPVGGVE